MARASIHDITEGEKVDLVSVGTLKTNETNVLEVVLSERNLLSLLAKLHIPQSKRTIYNGDVPDGYVLKLVVEDDETHYGERKASPGRMHPDTEKLLVPLKQVLEEHDRKDKVVEFFKKGANEAKGEESVVQDH